MTRNSGKEPGALPARREGVILGRTAAIPSVRRSGKKAKAVAREHPASKWAKAKTDLQKDAFGGPIGGKAEDDCTVWSEDDSLDWTSASSLCLSLHQRLSKRLRHTRQAARRAAISEFNEAWGKTKTAQTIGDWRRRVCSGPETRTRQPHGWLAWARTRLRRQLRRSSIEPEEGPGDPRNIQALPAEYDLFDLDGPSAGFGVQHFIINNPGRITDYFDVTRKELCVGGSAKVYKAKERFTHVDRAIKRISKGNQLDYSRALQEVAIMKVMDHPNIIRLFEMFQDDRNIYLVMELCTGGDVLDRLHDTGPFSEIPASVIVRTVLMTLNYMHSNGYVHRDVKPENMMFKDARRDVLMSTLRLVDFGFSCKKPDDGKMLTTKVGSALYMAPEVLKGEYSVSCDAWSVGVMTYVVLCGYPPFVGSSDAETLHRVRSGKFIFHKAHWKDISKAAKHLVRHLLQPDPRRRISVRTALGHPWLKEGAVAKIDRMRDETVDRLLTFNTYHRLRRAAMLAVAYHIEAHDVRELVELFQGLDLNGDGLLTSYEFIQGVQACGIDKSWIQRMMQSVDADNSGVIDLCEFLAATLDQNMYIKNHAVLYRAFRCFDQDDSGGLTKEEIATTLHMSDPSHMLEVEEFFKDVDLNGDGIMDYGEFYALLQREIDPEATVFKAEERLNSSRKYSHEGHPAIEPNQSEGYDSEELEGETEENAEADTGDDEESGTSSEPRSTRRSSQDRSSMEGSQPARSGSSSAVSSSEDSRSLTSKSSEK